MEGADAFQDTDFKVGRTHTGGKSAKGAVGAGMRIAHNDGISRPNKALFWKQGMADAVSTDIKKITNMVSPGPLPQYFTLSGRL